MVVTLSPSELTNLLTNDDVDVVDVRDAHELATGRLPHSRHVPLDAIRKSPRSHLTKDGVVFVCARGMRSLTAAKVAERLGFSRLYSLDGGTSGWARAGLPLVP